MILFLFLGFLFVIIPRFFHLQGPFLGIYDKLVLRSPEAARRIREVEERKWNKYWL